MEEKAMAMLQNWEKDGFFNWTAQRKQGEKLYSSMDVKELEGD